MRFCDWVLVFGFLLIGAGIGFGIGAMLAENSSSRRWAHEAIEHGAAEYVIVDEATGAVEFRWKEQ